MKNQADMNRSFTRIPAILRLMFTLLMILILCGISGVVVAQDGETLFRGNCASCHKIDENMTGPALRGVSERWAGKEELLHEWIKNPQKVADMGDPYVNTLLAEWMPKGGMMTPQSVSDEDIVAILDYVENYTAPAQAQGPATDSGTQGKESTGVSATWMMIIAFLLLILIFSLWGIRSSISNAVREKEGLEPEYDPTYGERVKAWLVHNKVFASVVAVLIIVFGVVNGYEALMGIGVYEGYKPEQPIAFNHMIHAGENEVACVYCHSSALESKHAGIPSANVCMNCHKGITSGRSEDGTAEIQKIYAAVGWDQESQSYTGEEKPIVWTKVHNLPDLAYFNHAQHYVVGNIACETCHGPVGEEYTVAEQFAPLTMGWCIDCHNETPVTMDGNGYYDEIHSRMVEHGKDVLKDYLEDGQITARELGGWECSKCHY